MGKKDIELEKEKEKEVEKKDKEPAVQLMESPSFAFEDYDSQTLDDIYALADKAIEEKKKKK